MTKPALIGHKSRLTGALNRAVSAGLAPLERSLTRRAAGQAAPVCFILGPPRSGTTLLYELLATCFHCAYLSVLARRLYRVPVAATWLVGGRMRRRQGAFDSRYGALDGAAAPDEAGRIWNHWMPYASPYFRDEPGLPTAEIQAKLAAMAAIAGQPVLVKNLHLQSEIARLTDLFPRAVFLHVERNWADNIRSILRGRVAKPPIQADGWWSTQPRGWEAFRAADAVEQSCAQVPLCHREIREDLGRHAAPGRVLEVNYEALCRDPGAMLERIGAFLARNGMAPAEKALVRDGFAPRTGRPLEPETEARIARFLSGQTILPAPGSHAETGPRRGPAALVE